MTALAPETLLDEDDLAVSWLPGRGERVVVSFTGIGEKHLPRAEGLEFPKIASQDGANDVVFVIDRRRTWYNAPGLYERVIAAVTGLRERIGARRVVTLGNSMGGYGAVLFANPLGAELAVSFVPQFTMDDRVLRETRWQEYKAGMGRFVVASLAECMGPPCRFFVVHGGAGQDRKHWRRFPTGPNIEHYVLPLMTHAAASRMKVSGRLDPLVTSLLDGDFATARRMMLAEGAHLRDPARPGEGWRLWAAGQSTRLGHRIAGRVADWFAPVPREVQQ